MKKVLLCMLSVIFLLSGCAGSDELLEENEYDKASLKKYEDGVALSIYEGDVMDAKLVDAGRYVRDDGVIYFSYQIYIKPIQKLTSKQMTLRLDKNKKQDKYFGGKLNQNIFSTMSFPMKQKDKVECLELEFNVFAQGYDEVDEDDWIAMMKNIKLELKSGNKKEVIKFQYPIKQIYSGNENESIAYFGIIR